MSPESPTPEALLLELERLDKAATPGPWVIEHEFGAMHLRGGGNSLMCDMQYYPWVPSKFEDWLLISAMRSQLPAILAHLRALASLYSRGSRGQEHLDTLLRQEREKALNEAEAAVRAVEKEEADNMYQAYCDIAHNTATRCADAVAGVPK